MATKKILSTILQQMSGHQPLEGVTAPDFEQFGKPAPKGTQVDSRAQRILLAGTSVAVLSLHTLPAVATPCIPVSSSSTLAASTACIIWSGGNLSVTNTGTLTGASNGLSITGSNATGTLMNGGTISGTTNGIDNVGTVGALTNESGGLIDSSSQYGLYSTGSIGTVTNESGGTISGSSIGLALAGNVTTVVNNGFVSSNIAAAVGGAAGIGTLNNTGTISGTAEGVMIVASGGSIGTLTNSGTITSSHYAIYNSTSNGTITLINNAANGLIQGAGGNNGVDNHGSIGTLTNSGTISSTNNTAVVNNGTFGSLVNTSTGTLQGNAGGQGLYNQGTILSVSNDGLIAGNGNAPGVFNTSGGQIATLINNGTIAASGTDTGIYNTGGSHITTLTNNGTISGGSTGVNNGFGGSGSIGTLTNTGKITGTAYGIWNGNSDGSIATLNNSGVISGATDALRNDANGSIGQITDSGIIAGNILNSSTHALSIAGGTGTTFGVLTGYNSGTPSAANPGAVGSISNTSADLVFSSGNILLNDNIDVGSHTVTNNGATLELANPISINGAYQQSGGKLIADAASTSSYGYLSVTGKASVANASIVIKGSGLSGGGNFTIVRAGATGSYTGDSASVIGTSGLSATVTAVGDDLVVALTTPSSPSKSTSTFTAKGLAAGGVAAPLGSVLDAINGASSSTAVAFQNNVLVPLALLPTAQQGEAIKQLAPVQNSFQVVNAGVSSVLGVVEQHQQLAMAYNNETGEAAGSGIYPNTSWAQILGGTAHRNSDTEAAGYRSRNVGLAAGADHLFTPNLLGGAAFSWLRARTHGSDSANGETSTLNSYQLTLYGTWRHQRAFVDGQLGTGWNHFDQNRSIAFLGETATAGYNGQQYLAHALAGYDLPISGPGNLTVTPLVGLRWLRAHNDGYTESGAGAANLSVNGQSLNSLTQEMGVKTSWRLATAQGTLEPEVTAAWLHDYRHSAISTNGVIGGEAFAVTTPHIAEDGARLDVAATLARSDQLSIRAEYDGEFRDGYQSNTALAKLIWQF